MYRDVGRGIGELIGFLLIVACVSVPLAVWKLIEIVIWVLSHVHWS